MIKKKIAIIFGGKSAEHEVSINSAVNILSEIDKSLFDPVLIGISKQGTWYYFSDATIFSTNPSLNDDELAGHHPISWISGHGTPYILFQNSQEKLAVDCAFPIIHGTMGEDGTLQGFFKIMNLPFVGCGVLASAVGMDKEFAKRLMTEAGIPNTRYVVIRSDEAVQYSHLTKTLSSPFFIKPANAGSSVGVHKIKSETSFISNMTDAFQYDHKILAEEFIEGREIECSVMGLNGNPKASLPGELVVKDEFYSYKAKYLDKNGAEAVTPADLTPEQTSRIQQLAVKTFKTLGCDGLARVDFFLRADGEIFVNEINTLPGFTQISMYPKMWQASGLSYPDLITQLINLAFEKHNLDNQLKSTF
jgi:D-alanine-D-alanine ligase